MTKKVIDKEWRSFAESAVPIDASDTQRQEMRRCFYAGARALLTGIITGVTPGDEVTDGDMTFLMSIEAELEAFYNDVLAGRA